MAKTRKIDVKSITLLGVLTALTVVLQLLGSFIKFGPFSISLTLIPIVVGAALCGPLGGAWLGLVFGGVVLLSGDAAAFLSVNVLGTILTVLLKGALCGLCAGFVYRLIAGGDPSSISGKREYIAALAAAVTAPVVNTGIFLLGCVVFFLPTITAWGQAAGFENVGAYMIVGLVGGNFLFELLFNVLLSPALVRLISLGFESMKRKV